MRSTRPTRAGRLGLALIGGLSALPGCSLFRAPPPAEPPTIASLQGRRIVVAAEAPIVTDEERTAAAYRAFLAAAPQAPQRAEALRRLGDLAMDGADRRLADGATPDYAAAIGRYQASLQAFPDDPGNDRVLYQLARAQEQGGQVEQALQTLTRLVAAHPATAYAAEAQFRRGELLFATRDYAGAEAAYTTVLQSAAATPYGERALYMQGWSRFKQGRLDEALRSFFGVLDARLAGGAPLARGDRELVDDTLRVTSIALSSLQGAASIPPLIDSPLRLGYEPRVYGALGEFYLHQQRVKDAADTFAAFARLRPLHAQAPVLLARVIEIDEANGFTALALDAKRDYVLRFGADSDFRRANPAAWEQAAPLLRTHLAALARHHHALAQKSHDGAEVDAAARWYRAWLAAFPADADAAATRFLLAELLFDARRYADAALEYEQVAYVGAAGARSADAGYAALLSHAALGDGAALQRTAVASALRFGERFGSDPRCGGVLVHAADQLFAMQDGVQAAAVARRALALPLQDGERRTAWTVIAHELFDRKAWSEAEQAYGQALAHAPAGSSGRAALVERRAAAIYEQGEAARAAGQPREAVALFARVTDVAPDSTVRATAQFDAAAALIGVQDWAAATRLLEDFRQRFPQHPLQAQVDDKLAAAYLAQQQWSPAAAEFERVAATAADPALARAALWQAATLHDKAADGRAAATYAAYLHRWPQPLEPALQARSRLAALSPGAAAQGWLREIVEADAAAGSARSDTTRALAAQAALALAAPLAEAYRQVPLVEPLQRQLRRKKAQLERALQAYATAADYGVAATSTAATFQTAALYQDFGQALLASQRPKTLGRAQRAQYDVLLEEQAFPFEEKAIALHAVNAQRAAAGVYDDWVRASFAALARLAPVRWAKIEREDPASALNQQGIALRAQGRFADARAAYEAAIAQDPHAGAPLLNLGILNDLYLGDSARALALYQRYQALVTPADATVDKWLAELKHRKPPPTAAAAAAAPGADGAAATSVASRKDPP